jgi:zinc transport system permease protein
MAVIATLIAAAAALGGLAASFRFDSPTGPTIVCVAALIFAASVAGNNLIGFVRNKG